MAKIERVPSGLLDYLKLRSQGRNPDDLLDNVRATLEQELFYDLERHESAEEPINMTSGQIEFIEVPADEIWKLLAVGFVRNPTGGGASLNVRASWLIERLIGAGANGVPFHSSPAIIQPALTAATGVIEYGHTLEKPFLVRAGQRITMRLDWARNVTTGADSSVVGTFYLHIVRMTT